MGRPLLTVPPEAPTQPNPAAMGRRLVGYGVALLAVLGIVVAGGDPFIPHYPILLRVGIALCLFAQVLVVVECLRPARLAWAITAAAVAGIVCITAVLLLVPVPAGLEWRTNIWLGPVLQFLILLYTRRWVWPWFALLTVGCWASVTVASHLDWRIQVLDLVFTIAPILTLAIGLAAITTLLRELRVSQLRRIHDLDETRRAEMREQERQARIRLAHDSLLHTLQRISRDWARPAPEEARTCASRACEDLRASAVDLEEGGFLSLHEEMRSALSLESCTLEFSGRDVQLPSDVSQALVGAAREAVRNVAKHVRSNAVVTVSRFGTGCRVIIDDEGPGFDTQELPAQRLGITQGIIQRMEEAGGTASITSGPLGTTVTLQWATEPFRRVETFGPVARTMISWLPLPVLGASLVHVLVFDVGPNALGVSLMWVGTALVSLAGMRQFRRAGLTPWQSSLLTVLAIALAVANYGWLSPEGTNGYDVWTPSLVGALMVLALPGRHLRHAIVLAVAVIVSTIAACVVFLGWETALGTQLGSIIAVVMYVLTPLALATGASILATHAAHTEELHAAARLVADLATERDATRLEWVTRMRALAEPFLTDISTGRVVSTDEAALVQASLLESRLRDELSLWPHGAGITERVHSLREQGWDCTLDATKITEVQRLNLLGVISQLPEALPGQHLHLTHRHGRAVATITDPPFSVEQWRQLSETVDAVHDEDFTQLRIPAAGVASLAEGHQLT